MTARKQFTSDCYSAKLDRLYWSKGSSTAGVVVLLALGLLSYARGADARPFIYGQF